MLWGGRGLGGVELRNDRMLASARLRGRMNSRRYDKKPADPEGALEL